MYLTFARIKILVSSILADALYIRTRTGENDLLFSIYLTAYFVQKIQFKR